MAAGRLLGIRLTGIYHTDFPQYVRYMTEDGNMEQLAWRYMLWFYDQMETIYVPSEFYRRQLAQNGFELRKLHVMKRGVDVTRFHPDKRTPGFFRKYGGGDSFKFLFVGRVSKEKNLELLLDAFLELKAQGQSAELVIVGDGPHLDALKQRYNRADVLFTGYLGGDELAQAYASADVFVFPSTTDTFGNVVLEAQASGLASIVSNLGGPAEIVRHGQSGLVVDVCQPGSLRNAMALLQSDDDLRTSLAHRGLLDARTNSWDQVLEDFWSHGARHTPSASLAAFRHIQAQAPRSLAVADIA